MVLESALIPWLQRGNQRRAVARSLVGIMTGTQLWHQARLHAPRINLRDVRAILRQLETQTLVRCINPEATSGRLFCVTPVGRVVFDQTFERSSAMPSLPEGVFPWQLSFLFRGHVRQAVFRAVCEPPLGKPLEQSATSIKRQLRETCPLTLNQTIRALRELEHAQLIHSVDPVCRRHLYLPTPEAIRLAAYLDRTPLPARATR
ncbi:MAG: hypothetical protein WC661_01580 [Opitutaceae bacterium]|jgi:Fe2+ or Zn2+ uptake regulation protein